MYRICTESHGLNSGFSLCRSCLCTHGDNEDGWFGTSPASWGRLSPCFMVLSLLPPPPSVFFFFLTFFPFLLRLCSSFALLFSSSGTLFLLFAFFLKQGDKNRVAHLPHALRPSLPTSPLLQTPSSLRTASPCNGSCWDCLGICFGQMYKRSPGTIKNVFSGGDFFLSMRNCPPPFPLPRLWWFVDLSSYLFSLRGANRAKLPPERVRADHLKPQPQSCPHQTDLVGLGPFLANSVA